MYIGINAQNLTKLLPIYNKSTSRKELLSELTNIYVLKGCEICCAVVSFQRKIDRLSTSECLLKARLSTMCIIHWLESSRQEGWEFDFWHLEQHQELELPKKGILVEFCRREGTVTKQSGNELIADQGQGN